MAKVFYLQSAHKFEIQNDEGTWLRLAAGISSFEPDTNEETSQDHYLDGDGFAETDVTGGQLIIAFEGHRLTGDAAQDFIFSKQLVFGDARKTVFRWTLPDGTTQYEYPCTIAGIKGSSGAAGEKGEIEFEVHANGGITENDVVAPVTPTDREAGLVDPPAEPEV